MRRPAAAAIAPKATGAAVTIGAPPVDCAEDPAALAALEEPPEEEAVSVAVGIAELEYNC